MSGFPSPATDYVESRLTPESICGINANSLIIETSSGFAVVERGSKPKTGDYVLVSWLGHNYFARPAGRALITEDGEAIEGEALDDVEVIGVVTWLVNRALDDEAPVM